MGPPFVTLLLESIHEQPALSESGRVALSFFFEPWLDLEVSDQEVMSSPVSGILLRHFWCPGTGALCSPAPCVIPFLGVGWNSVPHAGSPHVSTCNQEVATTQSFSALVSFQESNLIIYSSPKTDITLGRTPRQTGGDVWPFSNTEKSNSNFTLMCF